MSVDSIKFDDRLNAYRICINSCMNSVIQVIITRACNR